MNFRYDRDSSSFTSDCGNYHIWAEVDAPGGMRWVVQYQRRIPHIFQMATGPESAWHFCSDHARGVSDVLKGLPPATLAGSYHVGYLDGRPKED